MRPVNLIPQEERRGQRGPMRSGPIVYLVVGALVAALAGVTALVLTGNQIADSKAEVAQLRGEDAAVHARAQRLAAYLQFRALREQRVATVTSLANSRFDWERVMRELSRVLPSDVWLTNLTATSAPGVSISASGASGSSSGAGMRASVNGPALEISGCATGHEAVAGFVTALKDIGGVTRVGVQFSALPNQGSGGTSGGGKGSSGSAATDCRTRNFIAQFQIVAAFDAAPIPNTSASGTGAAPAATSGARTTAASASTASGG